MTNRSRAPFVALLVLAAAVFLLWPRTPSDPLPAADDASSILASIEIDPASEPVEFQLPLSAWPKVRAALEPATLDYGPPAGWVQIGSLAIITKTQRRVAVTLYDSMEPPGAFAAGPTFDRRISYRGGDSQQLIHEMIAAYEASKQTK